MNLSAARVVQRFAEESGGPQAFVKLVQELAEHKLRDRHLKFRTYEARGSDRGSVYVNFFNLPKSVSGAEGGGAEAENNRMMFSVYFSPDGASGKIEMTVSALPREYRLRAKTAPLPQLARYLVDFLTKVAADVPPNFTHTKMASNVSFGDRRW
jgi:hypothetical protein